MQATKQAESSPASRAMRVLGLTGGVGMGKSACMRLLQQRGIGVIDTDELAHQLVEPGQEALQEISQRFGAELLDSQGALRRQELAQKVFSQPEARLALESILHPRIRRLWLQQMELWRTQGRPLAVVVIPLLFEVGAQAEVDATLCVACSGATQRARLQARGWSAGQSQQRIGAQLPIEQKMARADFVIWSEAGLELHEAQLERILAALQAAPPWGRAAGLAQ